jgi:hypothetical protein
MLGPGETPLLHSNATEEDMQVGRVSVPPRSSSAVPTLVPNGINVQHMGGVFT